MAQLAKFPKHREAKDQVDRWYRGYRIIISEITATYGDGQLPGVSERTTTNSGTARHGMR